MKPVDHIWSAARRAEVEGAIDAEFVDRREPHALARVEQTRALAVADPGPAPVSPTVIREIHGAASPWTPLAIGLGLVAIMGLTGVIIYLLVRKKDDGSTTVLGAVDPRLLPQPTPAPQVYLINAGGGQAQVVRAEPVDGGSAQPRFDDSNMLAALGQIGATLSHQARDIGALVNHSKQPFGQSTMRTYRAPWLADPNTPAIRIATAGNVSHEVIVRVVAPPGALAAFSFSPNELNIPQALVAPGVSAVPAGDTLIVPAGQQQLIRMNAKQVLYAKGNMSPTLNPTGPVVVSISGVDNYASR